MEEEFNNKELDCKWNFPLFNNGTKQGVHKAIFTSFSGTPIPSLVRESIQNSLDAVNDKTKPVVVEFQFGHIQNASFPNFFGLNKHIRGCGTAFPKDAKQFNLMAERLEKTEGNTYQTNYIKVGDYNTIGMEYDKKTNDSPFDAFVHSEGTNSKQNANSGGAYGFGKGAYFNMSPIRTLIVSTKTVNNNLFFQGVSLLCLNQVEGTQYSDRGFYDNNNGFPICDAKRIPYKFSRCKPGTDIYIMGIEYQDNKIDARQKAQTKYVNEIILETLRNFWLAILGNKLEVIVKIGETVQKAITLQNLNSLMETYFTGSTDKTHAIDKYNPRPFYESVIKTGSSDAFIKKTATLTHLKEVELYIKKDLDAKGKIIFARSLRMIVQAKQYSSGFYGVFLCENAIGDECLKHMENPEHNSWNAKKWVDEDNNPVQEAIAIEKELESFIVESINEVFGDSNRKSAALTTLSKYISIDEGDIESAQDSDGSNPFGEKETDHDILPALPKTTKKRDNPKRSKGCTNTPNARVIIKMPAKPDDSGEYEGGDRSKEPHPPSPDPHLNKGKKHFKFDEDGIDGNYCKKVRITFRYFAQRPEVTNAIYNHTLLITNPGDEIKDALIEVTTHGEQNDEPSEIESSTTGTIHHNRLVNIDLTNGLNTIKITFKDGMQHSLMIEAYEKQSE